MDIYLYFFDNSTITSIGNKIKVKRHPSAPNFSNSIISNLFKNIVFLLNSTNDIYSIATSVALITTKLAPLNMMTVILPAVTIAVMR